MSAIVKESVFTHDKFLNIDFRQERQDAKEPRKTIDLICLLGVLGLLAFLALSLVKQDQTPTSNGTSSRVETFA